MRRATLFKCPHAIRCRPCQGCRTASRASPTHIRCEELFFLLLMHSPSELVHPPVIELAQAAADVNDYLGGSLRSALKLEPAEPARRSPRNTARGVVCVTLPSRNGESS